MPNPLHGTQRRFTPYRPWAPLTDAEWAILRPQIDLVRRPTGRPVQDLRRRIDAMLFVAITGQPWAAARLVLRDDAIRPDTLARQFRRLAHAGLWLRLLGACLAPTAPAALRRMEYWLCRLARRAMRVLGMAAARMVEALGLLTALPVLPWFLPRPRLFRRMWDLQAEAVQDAAGPADLPVPFLKRVLRVMRFAAGQPWHRRYAPL